MKDQVHHLKHIQKKVIQFARKESQKEVEPSNTSVALLEPKKASVEKKFDQNHRVPRILKRQPVH